MYQRNRRRSKGNDTTNDLLTSFPQRCQLLSPHFQVSCKASPARHASAIAAMRAVKQMPPTTHGPFSPHSALRSCDSCSLVTACLPSPLRRSDQGMRCNSAPCQEAAPSSACLPSLVAHVLSCLVYSRFKLQAAEHCT